MSGLNFLSRLAVLLSGSLLLLNLMSCGMTQTTTGSAVPVPATAPSSTSASVSTLAPFIGFVHQVSQQLVDGQNRPLVLRAVNLGGWLEWESWMWGGGLSMTTQTQLLARLTDLVGPVDAATFQQGVYQHFITGSDLAEAACLGFNAVRVPFNCRLLEDDAQPFVYKNTGWAVLDRLIDTAQANGLYVVLDLSAAPGGQSRLFMADSDPVDLWQSSTDQDRTVALWRAIAARYHTRSAIAGYDLINEPAAPSGPALTGLYVRIITAIREVDPSHAVILEGATGATDFSMFAQPLDPNQVYSFHMYTWLADHRADQLKTYRALSQSQNVPLWCGEFGENTYALIGSTVDLFNDPAQGVTGGWAFWSWKKTTRNTRYPALISFSCTADWGTLIDHLTTPLLHWSPIDATVRQGMADFLSHSDYVQDSIDPSMVDALFGVRMPLRAN